MGADWEPVRIFLNRKRRHYKTRNDLSWGTESAHLSPLALLQHSPEMVHALTLLEFVSLSTWVQRLCEIFSACTSGKLGFYDPVYMQLFSGRHCPLVSYQPIIPFYGSDAPIAGNHLPPAFIFPSRKRKTLLASDKTEPGLLWSSLQMLPLWYEFISWSQVARAVYGVPGNRSPEPSQLQHHVPGLYIWNNLSCVLPLLPLSQMCLEAERPNVCS